jgi:hypothetical protein
VWAKRLEALRQRERRRQGRPAEPSAGSVDSLADEAEMLLITRDRVPQHKFLLSQVRQGIETTFSQLWWQFVDRVFSRSWRGLLNMIQLKVLFYNLVHAGIVTV